MQPSENAAGKEGFNEFTVDRFDLGPGDAICERPGEISPPYANHGMKDGEGMRENWFPVLWRKG